MISVILYGSYARGDYTSDSDVDIMILVNLSEEVRHSSDYDEFYIASREESEKQITCADSLLQMVE